MDVPTVMEAITKKLEEQILDGTFTTGGALNIDELARNYNVSKTPIREALGRLAREGLVTYKTRIGWSVCDLSPSDFDHYLEVRYILRRFISDNLAPYLDKLDFAKIESMNTAMKTYLKQGKFRSLFEEDDRFHMEIFSIYPNPVLLRYLGQISSLIRVQRIGMLERRLLNHEYSLYHNAPIEHDAIIEALHTRDQGKISEASERHQKTIMSALQPAHTSQDGVQSR